MNFETNNHYTFDFCKIDRDNTVVCYNGDENRYLYAHAVFPMKESLLNAEIWIDELGRLHIKGKIACIMPFYRVNGLLHNVPEDRRNVSANYIISHYTLKII